MAKKMTILNGDGTAMRADGTTSGVDLTIYDDAIPFIRVMPNDMPLVLQKIRRSRDTNMLAQRFISHGGRYLIALVEEEGVEYARLCAMVGGSGVDGLILLESRVENGPALLDAVDALVRGSLDGLDAAQ